jgi:hypothetical protein
MSTFSIIMAVAVLNIHLISFANGDVRLPIWARKIVFGHFARIACLIVPQETASPESCTKSQATLEPRLENAVECDIRAVLDELRKITRELEERNHEKRLTDEVKTAARVMDRVLFFICLIVEMTVTIVCLTIIPFI